MNRYRATSLLLAIAFLSLASLTLCSKSSAKAITSFGFPALNAKGVIDEANREIKVWIDTDQGKDSLKAEFVCAAKDVKVDDKPQKSGESINDYYRPVSYTVTAEDGSEAVYTIMVLRANEKRITSFSLSASNSLCRIYEEEGIIEATIPGKTDASALIASFKADAMGVSVGNVPQESGKTTNDFRKKLVYRAWAKDGSYRDYRVAVFNKNWLPLEPIVPGTEEKKHDPQSTGSGPEKEILAIGVSPSGILHVALSDAKDIADVVSIEVLRLVNDEWQKLGNSIRGRTIRKVSIAFGPEDRPYIACEDWTGGNESPNTFVRAHGFTDGSWSALKPDFTETSFLFAVSKDGTPHLSYWWSDSFGGGIPLKSVLHKEGAWQELGSKEIKAKQAAMGFDPSGILWLAWSDDQAISIERLANGAWEYAAGMPVFPAGSVSSLSLDFGKDGSPLIAYVEGDAGVRLVQLYASEWQEVRKLEARKPKIKDATASGIYPFFMRVDGEGRQILAFIERETYMVENAEFGTAPETRHATRILRFEGGAFRPIGSELFVTGLYVYGLAIDGTGAPLIYDLRSRIYRYE